MSDWIRPILLNVPQILSATVITLKYALPACEFSFHVNLQKYLLTHPLLAKGNPTCSCICNTAINQLTYIEVFHFHQTTQV